MSKTVSVVGVFKIFGINAVDVMKLLFELLWRNSMRAGTHYSNK